MPALSTSQEDQILEYCDKNPDTEFSAIADYFSQQFGSQVTQSQVHHLVIDKELGIRTTTTSQSDMPPPENQSVIHEHTV